MHDQPHALGPAVDFSTALHCRYRAPSIIRAVARSAAGAGTVLAIWLTAGASWTGALVGAPLAGVFLAYGIAAVLRGRAAVVVDDTGLTVTGPLGGQVKWAELSEVRLAFYATRRRAQSTHNGWMVLDLRAGAGRVRVESEIDGFLGIAKVCRARADAAGIKLTPVTLGNFAALDLWMPAPAPVRGLKSVLARR